MAINEQVQLTVYYFEIMILIDILYVMVSVSESVKFSFCDFEAFSVNMSNGASHTASFIEGISSPRPATQSN